MNIIGLILIGLAIWFTWMTLSTAWAVLVGLIRPKDAEEGRRARGAVLGCLIWAVIAVVGWFLGGMLLGLRR